MAVGSGSAARLAKARLRGKPRRRIRPTPAPAGWRDWILGVAEALLLGGAALVMVIAALGQFADWFVGAEMWRHLLPFAVAVLGLAVPVTASFIISWVIIGPALQTLGVSPPETAMFIFYYAVLSEVTPPTALAAVAAAAITGGNTIATMWQTWKYTLPAFLAPIAFVITDNGSHLLMQGDAWSIVWTTAVSIVAVAALAAVTGGWIVGPASWVQRLLCAPAAILLLYLQPLTVGVGLAFLAASVAANLITRSARPVGEPS